MDLDCPRSFAGVVQQFRPEGVGFFYHGVDEPAAMALGQKLQPVAEGALGEGGEKSLAERGSEGTGDREGISGIGLI
jgi:hypothetical protein